MSPNASVIEVSLNSGQRKMRFYYIIQSSFIRTCPGMGKHYDQEFRDYVSKLVIEEGRKAADVARELEISSKSISRWVSAYRQKNCGETSDKYLTPNEVEKLKKQHEKELEKLREENEILKKAMHIFTKNQA